MSALDQIEVLAQKLADEPYDEMKGPADFRCIEANERHEGHRQAGTQILNIIRKERLTPEKIKSMTNDELMERIERMDDLSWELKIELINRASKMVEET